MPLCPLIRALRVTKMSINENVISPKVKGTLNDKKLTVARKTLAIIVARYVLPYVVLE